ncbi:purine permease 21 [Quercus suber]|uniref:Probable purine permease n=1 Tax=Quercus suber TaxID=58331 RepID=A0AAW0KQ98_QUESU
MKLPRLKHYKWWLRVAAYSFLVAGQTTATLLGRLYYDQGGNSKWMETFVQSAGFPILLPLLFFFSPSLRSTPSTPLNTSSMKSPPFYTLAFLYLGFGLMLTFNNLIQYRLENMIGVPKGKYVIGFLCTIGASATYSLDLSSLQLSFQRVIKDETFSAVLDMQIYASFFTTCCCLEGLFASGEWKLLGKEVENYGKGRVSYMMTLIWTAVTCQISSIGMLGLIFEVSSLFSNVISTFALPVVPILAVILFHDKMDGVKVMALLLAVWGFLSYMYQHYLDDSKSMVNKTSTNEASGTGAVIDVC